MKPVILVLGAALILASCGGENGDGTASERHSQRRIEYLLGPEIHVPAGPPPKHLVIKDLKTGSGAVAHRGDRVGVNYVGVFYESGDKFDKRWLSLPPAEFRLGYCAAYGRGFQEGIDGMREGGQREIIVPARLTPDRHALIYIIALGSVKPRADSRPA